MLLSAYTVNDEIGQNSTIWLLKKYVLPQQIIDSTTVTVDYVITQHI